MNGSTHSARFGRKGEPHPKECGHLWAISSPVPWSARGLQSARQPSARTPAKAAGVSKPFLAETVCRLPVFSPERGSARRSSKTTAAGLELQPSTLAGLPPIRATSRRGSAASLSLARTTITPDVGHERDMEPVTSLARKADYWRGEHRRRRRRCLAARTH
jgi:hypothetical protein